MAAPGGAPRSPVRAVLVDLDDTIFDHSLTCRDAIASLRRSEPYLRRRPLNDLWTEYLALLDAVAPATGTAGPTVAEARIERWRRLARSCGRVLSDIEASELSSGYRERYQRLRREVPGAGRLLERLHHEVKVVIVTNNEVAEQEEKVRFLGIGSAIDGLVVSQAVGWSKPDRRIFETALTAAGTGPAGAAMLGDSWTSDIEGAVAVGIRPVWFNRFVRPRPPGPSVEELRSLRPAGAAQRLLLGRHGSRATASTNASEL